eukprot:scaffold876_cov243-Pinguiococcus_pyrenoidosus.AAC.39
MRLRAPSAGAQRMKTLYTSGMTERKSSPPVVGALTTRLFGEGELKGALAEWSVRVRNGARRLESASIHSSQRVGQPL